MAGGITFAAAEAELATISHNGICVGDLRIMSRVNEATKGLLDELVPVNGMATYDIVGVVSPTDLTAGTQIFLPKELENVIEAEVLGTGTVLGGTDIRSGWYDLVNNFAYVDPGFAHDNPMVDLFLTPDPGNPAILRRLYDYPNLSPGATVRVTGAKRYVPVTAGSDYLIIQNIRALKLMIIGIEQEENNKFDEGAKYRAAAIELLKAEIRKHQLDPRNTLKRKGRYQSDLITFAEGTLGRTRAKLALEIPNFQLRGRTDIGYMVNRASQMLLDRRNQLAVSGRMNVHLSTDEIPYVQANIGSDMLSWTDYPQIRLMVQSFTVEDNDQKTSNDPLVRKLDLATLSQELQKRAYDLLTAQIQEQTEVARHGAHTTTLNSATYGSFGYLSAKLALDLQHGLTLSVAEVNRLLNRVLDALVHRENILRISMKWDVHETPGTEIPFTPISNPAAMLSVVIPGSLAVLDYDIVRRLAEFFYRSDNSDVAPADAAREQLITAMEKTTYDLLEARLSEALEFKRRTIYETELTNADPTTAGYYVARLALDLPNGLKLSRLELLRLVNSAEHRLMERGKWKRTQAEFSATVVSGMVLFPSNVESITAASLNGIPIQIRGRYFEYHENTAGYLNPNYNNNDTSSRSDFVSSQQVACVGMLLDQGEVFVPDTGATRRQYKLLTGDTNGVTVRVLAKLRWTLKGVNDALVLQNYEAMRLMVLSIVNTADPKLAEGFLEQAVGVLEKELQEYLAGIKPHVEVATRGIRRIRMMR